MTHLTTHAQINTLLWPSDEPHTSHQHGQWQAGCGSVSTRQHQATSPITTYLSPIVSFSYSLLHLTHLHTYCATHGSSPSQALREAGVPDADNRDTNITVVFLLFLWPRGYEYASLTSSSTSAVSCFFMVEFVTYPAYQWHFSIFNCMLQLLSYLHIVCPV